jgi:ankyrin repeat protein
MSDSKELSVLIAASERLSDCDDDDTIHDFCHSAADVSAFEDALQQCSTEPFQAEAALSLSTYPEHETVQETMKTLLWHLLTDILTRNGCANAFNQLSWSLDGYSMVARIAKSILSSWCIDASWIIDVDRGYKVFLYAVEHGHTSVVELLLADPRVDKASIDHANRLGRTALMHATSSGHTSIVELLLADPGMDKDSIDHTDIYGSTALMRAASNGDTSVFELLLADPRVDKASIDHGSLDGETALLRAASNGQASILELLLADPRVDKASIDHANQDGWTALMCASNNGRTCIVELLLADPRVDKASIDHVDQCGQTALMRAAISGRTSLIKLLLADRRVDKTSINHTSTNNSTAVRYASSNGHAPVAKLLIRDSRTSWESIVRMTHDWRVVMHGTILSAIIAELTRRQMCVIYPSANPLSWPVPVRSDAESGDAESGDAESGIPGDVDGREDGITEPEPECALITSFFKSYLFDVNVLRIIREYAMYMQAP